MRSNLLITLTISLTFALVSCGSKPKSDPTVLEDIKDQILQGNLDQALAANAIYTSKYPTCPDGWATNGWAHAKTNDFETSVTSFQKAIELDPQLDNAYVGLGVVKRKKGDIAGARQAYQKAIELKPDNPEALSSLLVLELLESNYHQAVKFGEQAWLLKQDPTIAANLSVAYAKIGNDTKKWQFFEHAKRLDYPAIYRLQSVIE